MHLDPLRLKHKARVLCPLAHVMVACSRSGLGTYAFVLQSVSALGTHSRLLLGRLPGCFCCLLLGRLFWTLYTSLEVPGLDACLPSWIVRPEYLSSLCNSALAFDIDPSPFSMNVFNT